MLLNESFFAMNGKLILGEGQLLQELWDLTQLRDPPPSVASVFKRQGFLSLAQSREECAQQIEEYLEKEQIPPNRLLQLLAMGQEYERLLKEGISLTDKRQKIKEGGVERLK